MELDYSMDNMPKKEIMHHYNESPPIKDNRLVVVEKWKIWATLGTMFAVGLMLFIGILFLSSSIKAISENDFSTNVAYTNEPHNYTFNITNHMNPTIDASDNININITMPYDYIKSAVIDGVREGIKFDDLVTSISNRVTVNIEDELDDIIRRLSRIENATTTNSTTV